MAEKIQRARRRPVRSVRRSSRQQSSRHPPVRRPLRRIMVRRGVDWIEYYV